MSESSSSSGKCPQCGAALPAGAAGRLCPVCLMAQAMVPTGQEGEATPSHPVLSPPELAPHFPQLEILECLGRGGMGVVYKARQKSLNRLVALKLLTPERVGDADFAERFQREAQALAALSHPHIVTVHDFGQAGGFYFLLMEFVDGVNLRQAMKAGRFTPEQALAIVPPVCEALQYAHEHGVVHRDIKPENLLLDKDGRVKIADFGIARMLGAMGARLSEVAQSDISHAPSSQVVGTPQYMAPEQKEHRATDHRADIYSLGVVLYELLTGELPADKLQPPSRKVTIDVRLDEIVLRALEQEPERRYQTAGDFRTQVETFTHATAAGSAAAPVGDDRTDWRFPLLVFAFLYALLLICVLRSYSELPGKIAVHFDGVGRPNGWQSRSSYAWFMCLEPLVEMAFFWLISRCVVWLPIQVSVPRRDYWLTKERRPELAALMLRWFLWLGCGLVLFDAALHASLLEANRAKSPMLSMEGEQFLTIAFLVALMIWIVMFIMRVAEAGRQKSAKRSRFWNWVTMDRNGRRRPSWHIFLLRVLIAMVVALPLRQFVIRPYTIAGSSVEPELPTGSHVAVWLPGHGYHWGDIIAYDQDGKAFVARVVRSDADTVTVNRNGSPDEAIPLSRIAGRVVSVYWRATPKVADTASGKGRPGNAPALTKAEDEIIRLAERRVYELRASYDRGAVPQEEVVEAEGELALAYARGDAVKQAKARLDTATKLVPLIEARFQAGAATNAELNYAQQRKLLAELELQRARSGDGKRTP